MLHAPSFEKILVTGGSGFIGRHLLEALVAGGFDTVAIARRLDQVDNLPAVLTERIRWIELDLLDRDAVSRVIQDQRPTVVFHLAGTRGKDVFGERAVATCHELNRATASPA